MLDVCIPESVSLSLKYLWIFFNDINIQLFEYLLKKIHLNINLKTGVLKVFLLIFRVE